MTQKCQTLHLGEINLSRALTYLKATTLNNVLGRSKMTEEQVEATLTSSQDQSGVTTKL